MNIDMKRLETSREYWDEIAPEGAEVYRGCGLFSKWVDGIEQVCDTAEGWFESTSPWSKDMYDQDEGVVFRPDPTAEWNGEDLPPVGCKVEVDVGFWTPVTVLAVDIDTVVWRNGTDRISYMGTHIDNVRKVRTKAERQRDELINVMGKAEIRGCMTRTDFENIADVILASGYTKP